MIDIHHHCLPGVDDGPRDWEEALDLCHMAAEAGVETIVATPHVLRGRWSNTSRPELESLIAELHQKLGDKPQLLLGSEYFFAHDVVEVLQNGSAIVPLAGSRYVLIEFASQSVPPMVEQPFYRMQLEGWTPIIAHPERNSVFQSKPELLRSLVELGAKTQITTGSLVGAFGSAAEESARRWLREGLVHFAATDAHSCKKRPPVVAEAREVVEELVGATAAEALFRGNPQAVVEGRGLIYEPEPAVLSDNVGLIARIRKFLQPR